MQRSVLKKHSKELKALTPPLSVRTLTIALALYGLYLVVPGFLPKHIRDHVVYFFKNPRGLGDVVYLLTMALLLYPAHRLTRGEETGRVVDSGRVRNEATGPVVTNLVSGIFVCLAMLFCVDLLFEIVLRWHETAVWVQRILFLALVVWGLWPMKVDDGVRRGGRSARANGLALRPFLGAVWRAVLSLPKRISNHASVLVRTLPHWGYVVLFGVVLFLLIRQQLHYHTTRAPVGGDELYWWYTASEYMMNHGLGQNLYANYVVPRGYTPAIPWLISFPVRILGVSGDYGKNWLFGFPLFVFLSYLGIIFSLARTGWAALATTSLLLVVFSSYRDLHSMFAGSLYGEAPAALLTALVMIELFDKWLHKEFRDQWTQRFAYLVRPALGSAAIFAIASLSKPPISLLVVAVLLLGVLALLTERFFDRPRESSLSSKRITSRVSRGLSSIALTRAPFVLLFGRVSIFVGMALLSLVLFKVGLFKAQIKPEYQWSIESIRQAGFQWRIPYDMLRGCFTPNTFPWAYTLGLILIFIYTILLKSYRAGVVLFSNVLLQWGFVLGLYATLWSRWELGSAGRYLSHSAIASVLLLPWVFGGGET